MLKSRPEILKNINQLLLHPNGRTISRNKAKVTMNLLKYILSKKYDFIGH